MCHTDTHRYIARGLAMSSWIRRLLKDRLTNQEGTD
jgi:hypothetical protein